MATVDTTAIYKTLRDGMLAYSDPVSPGDPLTSYVGVGNAARIYQESAPAGPAFPYAVMRLFNDRSGIYGERTEANLEIMVWDRPRSQLARARRVADLIDKSLKKFTSSGSALGFLRVTGRLRDNVPQGTGDADAEIIQIRFLFDLIAWPQYLTSA